MGLATVRTQDSVRDSARALRFHRFLLRLALAGINVYAWIFAFQYFFLTSPTIEQAFARTVLLYGLSQTVTCLATPYAARALRHGSRRSIVFALVCASASFVLLGATFEGFFPLSVPLGIIAFSIGLGAYRSLYWIPYEVEARGVLQTTRRASLFREIVVALAPLGVGLLIASSGEAPLWSLFGAGALVLLSALPLIWVSEVHERFSWKYRETFAHLMDRAHRVHVSRSILEGMIGAAMLLLWPIAIFLIVGWSYGMLGLVLSLTFLFAMFGRGVVRSVLRRVQVHESRLVGGFLAASPWLLRLLVASPISIVLVDSYFYTTASLRHGLDHAAFEQSSDGGSYIDEHTALKEMALSIGRIVTCALAVGLALLFSLPFACIGAFTLAALASLALHFWY